jgi:hypothetical protein
MVHRYACDVLEEFRKVDKTRRYDRVAGLIEELQTMFNRMESKLYGYRDIREDEQRLAELKRDTKKWERKLEKAKKKCE